MNMTPEQMAAWRRAFQPVNDRANKRIDRAYRRLLRDFQGTTDVTPEQVRAAVVRIRG